MYISTREKFAKRSRMNGPPALFASRALIGWNLKTCQTEISRYSFHMNRAYIDIEVSKYHKIYLGKIAKNSKIGNFEGSSIWFKRALEKENRLQKYRLSSCLLSPFS